MKTFAKRLCALLLLAATVLLLAACGGGDPGKETGKTQTETGGETQSGTEPAETGIDWDKVDFGGETLRFSVSCNQGYEVTYRPADAYTKGPDEIGDDTDSVQKLVYNRNRNAEEKLGLQIDYIESDLKYDQILEDMQKWVQIGENAPDIYNNDAYGVSRAMINGFLWNVATPGEDAGKSYFDLDADCWFQDYMNGMTFMPEKRYVLAGDYFLDVIRMAWLYYVNLDLLAAYSPESYDQEWLYYAVEHREWDYETMMFISEYAWRDDGEDYGTVDKTDSCIGTMINHCSAFVFTQAAGQDSVALDEDNVPYIIENNPTYADFAQLFIDFFNAPGIYYEYNVENSTIRFMENNVLFAMSVLGEMESEDMRNLGFTKGVVPVPLYDIDRQEDYITITHDQAEVGGILVTTHKFSEASAYMQYINEQSGPVLREYYEKALKLRYNEDISTKKMIDIVYETIGTPFGLIFKNAVFSVSPLPADVPALDLVVSAENRENNFASTYAASIDAWRHSLEAGYQRFLELE